MTVDDMLKLRGELQATLVARGRNAEDVEAIVAVASQAARDSMQRLVEVVGTAPEANRDLAIILALNIMERLALSGYKLPPTGASRIRDGMGG